MYTQAQYERRDDRPVEDHVIRLSNVSWEDYQRLLAMRGDHSGPRFSYLEGEVEIMSPSRTYEAILAYREALRSQPGPHWAGIRRTTHTLGTVRTEGL